MSYNKLYMLLVIAFTVSACAGGGNRLENNASDLPMKPDGQLYQLHFPNQDRVAFLGKVATNQKEAGGAAIMYPGGEGAAGFIAAIATHGVIASSAKESKKKERQEMANLSLAPYEAVINKLTFKELYPSTLSLSSGSSDSVVLQPHTLPSNKNTWVLESTPIFYVTQGDNNIILHNSINIYESVNPKASTYKSNIAVVLNNTGSKFLDNNGVIDDGALFTYAIKGLFSESLRLGLGDFKHNSGTAASAETTTIRYLEDGKKKVERGQIIKSTCDRLIFKTLRQWIKSVPAMNRDDGSCKQG